MIIYRATAYYPSGYIDITHYSTKAELDVAEADFRTKYPGSDYFRVIIETPVTKAAITQVLNDTVAVSRLKNYHWAEEG